jgi:aerobic-type carbon monoxide dehydrogenase small subunit (CoxS/CutS family)
LAFKTFKRRLFNINGVDRWLVVEPEITLAEVLRNNLMLTGCKVCCNEGHCGTCTVIVDGKPNKACLTKMEKVAERAQIVTIEGIGIRRQSASRCRSPGWLTAARSAASARPAS